MAVVVAIVAVIIDVLESHRFIFCYLVFFFYRASCVRVCSCLWSNGDGWSPVGHSLSMEKWRKGSTNHTKGCQSHASFRNSTAKLLLATFPNGIFAANFFSPTLSLRNVHYIAGRKLLFPISTIVLFFHMQHLYILGNYVFRSNFMCEHVCVLKLAEMMWWRSAWWSGIRPITFFAFNMPEIVDYVICLLRADLCEQVRWRTICEMRDFLL